MLHVFFSFHYTHDYDRILQVMDIFRKNTETSCTPFIADEEIERMKQQGLESIHTWIEEEVKKADAVVVLIGEHCYQRYFIDYEITTARKFGIPIIGIFIEMIPDKNGKTGSRSLSPLDKEPVFDWERDGGAQYLNMWIEKSVQQV